MRTGSSKTTSKNSAVEPPELFVKTPMKEQDDWSAKLIRLKRYETPGADYFERFIDDFHQRQRTEPLKVSVLTLARDRAGAWWRGVSAPARVALASASFMAAGVVLWGVSATGGAPETPSPEGPTLAEVSLIREF